MAGNARGGIPVTAWLHWLTACAGHGLAGVLIILLPLGLAVFCAACVAFAWAVKANQFDNLDVEARRILFDVRADEAQSNDRAAAAPEVQR